MSNETALVQMKQWEREHSLWEEHLWGYPVWSLDRFRWHRMEAFRDEQETPIVSSQPRGWERFGAERFVVAQSMRDLRRGGPGGREGRDIWLLGNSTYRRSDPEGNSHCIFASHLREQLGDRLLFLEFNGARIPSLEREDHCFLDAFQVPLLLASRALSRGLGPLLRWTQGKKMESFAPLSAERLVDRALYGKGLLALGRSWIRKRRPTAVFVLCGYTMHTPLQIAVREAGIPLIELQHGVLTGSHPGYAVPQLNVDQRAGLPIPDHMVIFGERFGHLLEEASGHWTGRWTVGGHPWLKHRVKMAPPTPSRERPSRRVLLFSQYEQDIRRQMLVAALHLKQVLPSNWEVLLKPHPREFDSDSFYSEATAAGVQMRERAEDSYVLLSDVDACVCSHSTLALEALAFSCRSMLLPGRWTPLMEQLVAEGAIESAEDPAGLAVLLQKDGPSGQRTAELSAGLFGVGQDAPDFEAVIDLVASQLNSG